MAEVEYLCADCEKELDVDEFKKTQWKGGVAQVYIRPCEDCQGDAVEDRINLAYDQGRDDGYSEGYDEGYNEADEAHYE